MIADPDTHVYSPGTPGWDHARQLFDASLNRRPGLVLQPQSVDSAIKLVASLQDGKVPFTLRSGGHSAAGNSVKDGICLVDLSKLRAVEVDYKRGVANIAAGALLSDLDYASTGLGLATTGGTVSHTGVIGLALGGGVGWLMGRHGLTCDNIVELELVTGGQTALIGSSDVKMRTLRGTGHGVGLVSRLTLALYPIEPSFRWFTHEFFDADVASAFQRFSVALDELPEVFGCSFTVQSDQGGSVKGIVDLVAPATHKMILSWTTRICDAMWNEAEMPYLDIQRMLDSQFSFGSRSYRRSACLDEVGAPYIDQLVRDFRSPSPFARSVTFDVLHGRAMDSTLQARSTFLRRRFIGLLVCKWTDPQADAIGREYGRLMFDQISDFHREASIGTYSNYSSESEEVNS